MKNENIELSLQTADCRLLTLKNMKKVILFWSLFIGMSMGWVEAQTRVEYKLRGNGSPCWLFVSEILIK
jgi:hypothetical protein